MSINLPTVTGAAAAGFGLLLLSDRVDEFAIGALVTGIALIILGQYASKDTSAPLRIKEVVNQENVENEEKKSSKINIEINPRKVASVIGTIASIILIIGASFHCGARYTEFQLFRMR